MLGQSSFLCLAQTARDIAHIEFRPWVRLFGLDCGGGTMTLLEIEAI